MTELWCNDVVHRKCVRFSEGFAGGRVNVERKGQASNSNVSLMEVPCGMGSKCEQPGSVASPGDERRGAFLPKNFRRKPFSFGRE